MELINIKNLTKEIDGKVIIDDVSFKIRKNDFTAILGKSGAGKSTILSLLSGIDFVSEGEILFEGTPLDDPRDKLMKGNKDITVVKQDYDLYPYHRVCDILELPIRMLNNDIIDNRIQEMLSFFDLKRYEFALPKELSGGMKQRLSIAFAMITYPKVLLLDEPFSHLDAHTSLECLFYIKRLAKKYETTVLYVTHETQYALMFASEVIVMSNGKIIQKGKAQDVYDFPKSLEVARLFGAAELYNNQIIRPEQVELVEKGISGEVMQCLYLGDRYLLRLDLNGESLLCYSLMPYSLGDSVEIKILV